MANAEAREGASIVLLDNAAQSEAQGETPSQPSSTPSHLRRSREYNSSGASSYSIWSRHDKCYTLIDRDSDDNAKVESTGMCWALWEAKKFEGQRIYRFDPSETEALELAAFKWYSRTLVRIMGAI